MVVIAVIGLLAGMLTPMAGKLMQDAKKTKARGETKAIADAIGMYKQYYGYYPAGSCGSCGVCYSGDRRYNYSRDDGGCGPTTLNTELVSGNPKFLSKQIGNDPWNRAYSYHLYTYLSHYQDFVVYSSGPNQSNESWNGDLWNTGSFNGDDIGAFYDEE